MLFEKKFHVLAWLILSQHNIIKNTVCRDILDRILSNVKLGALQFLINATMPSYDNENRVQDGWSSWKEWGMCSQSCGTGRVYRRRLCLKNAKVTDSKHCNDSAIDYRVCQGEKSCLVNGGWTRWTKWKCSAKCGPGDSVRYRTCTNPTPSNGGKECDGSAIEEGKCWLTDCHDVNYTLSPTIISLVQTRLKKTRSYLIKSGGRVILPCEKEVTAAIFKEFPNSNTEWTKNGQRFEPDTFRLWINDEDFVVSYASSEDTGVYECTVHFARNLRVVVSVVVLVVQDSRPLKTHQDESLVIECLCLGLSSRYNNLSQQLIFNDRIVKEEKCGREQFRLEPVYTNYTGEWRCQILERETGGIWVTNVISVMVLPPRSWIDKTWRNPTYLITFVFAWWILTLIFGLVYAQLIHRRNEYQKLSTDDNQLDNNYWYDNNQIEDKID